MKYYITLLDYMLLPVYLGLIYWIASMLRNRFYPHGHPWRQYFLPGLTIKILGSLLIGAIYQYYYGGGDTSEYFYQAQTMNAAFKERADKWLAIMTHTAKWYDPGYWPYLSKMYWYNAPPEFMIIRILSFTSLFTFNTYLPTSVIFAALSFSGSWALFRILATFYPDIKRVIAICVLFIPSIALWGSGIFKDTICMAGLGWLTFSTLKMLVYRDFSVGNILLGLLSFYLISVIKVYILIAYIPGLILWIMFIYLRNINSGFVRFILMIPILIGATFAFSYGMGKLSESLGKYSIENMASTAQVTRDWIAVSSTQESIGYDIGGFEPTFMGMVKKLPLAVNVTLFRPYLWETKKALQFISAIEAAAFFLLTLKVLLSVGIFRFWRAIMDDPTIQFCIIFTLIFAFAVGISSYNFGTLSRYKIPCLPFYALSLVLIYYRYNDPEKDVFSLRG